jgi:hypothetical protein
MKVICIEVARNTLPSWHPKCVRNTNQEIPINRAVLGQEYLVCGILMRNYGPDYLLQDLGKPDWPLLAPAQFFKMSSPTQPEVWFAGHVATPAGDTPAMGYLEWVSRPLHFEGLVENNFEDIEIFEKRANEIRLATAG